jgi:hypothetical protein
VIADPREGPLAPGRAAICPGWLDSCEFVWWLVAQLEA